MEGKHLSRLNPKMDQISFEVSRADVCLLITQLPIHHQHDPPAPGRRLLDRSQALWQPRSLLRLHLPAGQCRRRSGGKSAHDLYILSR